MIFKSFSYLLQVHQFIILLSNLQSERSLVYNFFRQRKCRDETIKDSVRHTINNGHTSACMSSQNEASLVRSCSCLKDESHDGYILLVIRVEKGCITKKIKHL